MIAMAATTPEACAQTSVAVRHHILLLVTCVVTLIYGLVIAGVAAPYGGNLSALVLVGDQSPEVQPGGLGHHVVMLRHSAGYDGQEYYYVADDPFLQRRQFRDAFRYQRIGYPLLAWAVSRGQRAGRPLALALVNLAAVAVITYVSGLTILVIRPGASPWWAMVCAVNPSLLIGVTHDLTEPLSMAFSLLGLYLWLQRRVGWAALAFAAALLTRELAFLFLLPLIGTDIMGRRWRSTAFLGLAIVPYAIWQVILGMVFGENETARSGSSLGMPFVGITTAMHRFGSLFPHTLALGEGQSIMLVVIFTVAATVIGFRAILSRPTALTFALTLHGGAALAGNAAIWIGYYSAARVFGGLFVLPVLIYLQQPSRLRLALVIAAISLTIFTLTNWVMLPGTAPYTVTP